MGTRPVPESTRGGVSGEKWAGEGGGGELDRACVLRSVSQAGIAHSSRTIPLACGQQCGSLTYWGSDDISVELRGQEGEH